MGRHAEVRRGRRGGGGDDVDRGPTLGDDVQALEPPSQVVRRVERGRARDHRADPLGDRGEIRQQGERFDRPARAMRDVGSQRGTVADENGVQAHVVGDPGQPVVVVDAQVGGRIRVG
jgi:hypothetical protein